MKIYKYLLSISPGAQSFDMPRGAKVLPYAHLRGEKVELWVEFDEMLERAFEPTEKRRFMLIGTSQVFADESQYVHTIIDGAYVWHIYEDLRP